MKKKLLREELRNRRKRYKKRRWPLFALVLLITAALAAGVHYFTDRGPRLEEEFARAETLLGEGHYQQAAEVFREIYREQPASRDASRALFHSAEILNLYLNNYHEALIAYLMVEKDYPDSELASRSRRQVADIYKNGLRDYNRAVVAYQKLLDGGVSDGDRIQYEVADCYFRLNNFEQARIEFDSLVKTYPESRLLPEVEYRIAVILSLEGSLGEAEKAYRQVIAERPGSPFTLEARFGLAGVLEEEEKLVESLKVLEALEGEYPNPEALAKRIDQVRERIKKKKRAI